MVSMKQANIARSEKYPGGYRCNACGQEWGIVWQQNSTRKPNDWYKCPNGCNSAAGKIKVLTCTRCLHEWPSAAVNLPKSCPNCNSPYWNKPKVKQSGPHK